VNEAPIHKISANLNEDELLFLDTIHTNHSEAIRILIRQARTKNNGLARQILMNISIGFIAVAFFFIWASVISWLFIILAVLIFGYEIYDIIHLITLRKKQKKETTTL